MQRFGTLESVLSAPDEAVASIAEREEPLRDWLVVVQSVILALQEERAAAAPFCSTSAAFLKFLSEEIGSLTEEHLLAVYLDAAKSPIHSEVLEIGRDENVNFQLRTLVTRCVHLRADRVVLAHNHPSGLCRPSPQDIAATHELQALLGAMEIRLEDHVIVTAGAAFSMRKGGLIE